MKESGQDLLTSILVELYGWVYDEYKISAFALFVCLPSSSPVRWICSRISYLTGCVNISKMGLLFFVWMCTHYTLTAVLLGAQVGQEEAHTSCS